MTSLDHYNAEWQQTLEEIFAAGIPQSTNWETATEIVPLLSTIASRSHQVFIPGGGNGEITGANVSNENACIELIIDGVANVIAPQHLYFEGFPGDGQASYFRIDSQPLPASGAYEEVPSGYEELLDLGAGKYVRRSVLDRGFVRVDSSGVEVPIPSGAKIVGRWLESASFVIFSKGSKFFRSHLSYEHNTDPQQFRSLVENRFRS